MTETATDRLQAALADRYRIEGELGSGGMAIVYLAHDLKHGRQVALKVLRAEIASAVVAERFLREIQLAARLTHPHILPLHDSGEAQGLLFYTMPYVRDGSLATRLSAESPLPLDEAVRITRDVADALSFAHGQGVVHRDIKPGNILLAEGHAVVADFGIAGALSTAGGDRLTESGLLLGTPAYMSPEQAGGQPDVDARADIYALGCVLYEMLAGEPPFTGRTAQMVMTRQLTDAPRPLRERDETVPGWVEQAILKALAKTPADRYQTAPEFARALMPPLSMPVTTPPSGPATWPQTTLIHETPPRRRVPMAAVMLGFGFLIALGVLFAWNQGHRREGASTAGGKVLAVLPFENLGPARDEYFADGVTDALRGKLASLPGVQVIARGSSAPYKKTTKPPDEIARELGARYLLTGTVRWEKGASGADRVLVSPELVEVTPGHTPTTKWQHPFDAALDDVFQVQADIAGRVVQSLDLAIGTPERRVLATKLTSNSAAYDYFLRGNAYFERGGDEPDLRIAEGLYERAVTLDSTFALAYAQLALTHNNLYGFYYDRTQERLTKLRRAAEQAVRLRPDLAEGHLALGTYHGRLNYARALKEFDAARKLQPSNASVYFWIGVIQRREGKWSEAVANMKKSVELNPRSDENLTQLAFTLIALRRYAEAEPYLTRAIEISPDQLDPYDTKFLLYVLWNGDTVSAAKAIREAVRRIGSVRVISNYGWGLRTLANSWFRRELLDTRSAHLPLGAFGSDTAGYYLWQAQVRLYGDHPETARVFFDSARVILETQTARRPGDAAFRARLGMIYAELDRRADARREGEIAMAMSARSKDEFSNQMIRRHLARILTRIGEADAAVDELAYLLSVPSYVSVPLLRVDQAWDPLRGHPRFERLLAGR